jgi:hypothetical protein
VHACVLHDAQGTLSRPPIDIRAALLLRARRGRLCGGMGAAEDVALLKAAKSGDVAAARAALDAGADKHCTDEEWVRTRPRLRCACRDTRGAARLCPRRRRW